jgi:hypothetical protein
MYNGNKLITQKGRKEMKGLFPSVSWFCFGWANRFMPPR